jgi:tetratricopeptide (TPR) repeat protein
MPPRPLRSRYLDILLALTLCLVASCVVAQAAVLMAADWLATSSRYEIARWAELGKKFDEAEWEQARVQLDRALALTPEDAALHDSVSQLHAARAQSLWTTGAVGSPEMDAYSKAVKSLETSVKLRPTNALAWANLTLMRYTMGTDTDTLFATWEEAARLGPREQAVETLLISMLVSMPMMTQEMLEWGEARKPGLRAYLEAQPQAPASRP